MVKHPSVVCASPSANWLSLLSIVAISTCTNSVIGCTTRLGKDEGTWVLRFHHTAFIFFLFCSEFFPFIYYFRGLVFQQYQFLFPRLSLFPRKQFIVPDYLLVYIVKVIIFAVKVKPTLHTCLFNMSDIDFVER